MNAMIGLGVALALLGGFLMGLAYHGQRGNWIQIKAVVIGWLGLMAFGSGVVSLFLGIISRAGRG